MMKSNSLKKKLILYITLSVTMMWLIATGVSVSILFQEMAETFDSSLEKTAQRLLPFAVAQLHQKNGGGSVESDVASLPNQDDEYLRYQVRDENGNVLLRSDNAPLTPFLIALTPGFADTPDYRFYTKTTPDKQIFVQVAEPKEERWEAIVDSVKGLLFPILLLVPLVGLIVFWVVDKVLAPLILLDREISQRDAGNLVPFQHEDSPQELLSILHSLNALMIRIQKAIAAERNFASNSAHELRTPIATSLAQTQRLMATSQDVKTQKRAQEIESSLKRLQRLSEKLLQLSRADASVLQTGDRSQVYPILLMIRDELKQGSNKARSIEIIEDKTVDLFWPVDMDATAIILRNLLENALRHGACDIPIVIFCDDENALHIQNDCDVLAPENLDILTHRFERASSQADGSGLGLAIVDAFIKNGAGHLDLFSPRIGHASGFEVVVKFE
ncbi:histidine kinase dimerization/phospho-acceptor domain-containing protein [Terasakiella sp.]|uniref:histidine kinase dimerization/phospho-acceptor domain-containing protein n=1 Tax=Terasakiella sp. TaxID=2034861 RepID=UPI003AA92F05